MRAVTLYFSAAIVAASLTACNKAPTAPQAAPAASAAAAVTYQCHSAQKSRDIFVRFNDKGGLYDVLMGVDAASLKPIGEVVSFDKNGVASWTEKNASWTETNTFDNNKGEWDWTDDPGQGGSADHAHYYCKSL